MMIRRLAAAALVAFAVCWATLARAQFADQATYGGTGGGTANAQTVTIANVISLNQLIGVKIAYIPNATNTGAATLNVNGLGAIAFRKPSRAGLVALVGLPEIVTGQPLWLMYDGTFFDILGEINAVPAGQQCVINGLVIVSDSGTPNSIMDISFSSATLVTASGVGASIGASSGSLLNVNITTGTGSSTAGGMDGEAVTANGFLDFYIIWNGSTIAGLAKNSATASPTLPAGYTYSCYAGSAKVNGSGQFYGFRQIGAEASYVNGGNNLATLPVIVSGAAGSSCAGSPTYASETVRGTAGAAPLWFPPSASVVYIMVNTLFNSAGGQVLLAPSTAYGGFASSSSNTNAPLASLTASGTYLDRILLESNAVAYCGSGAGAALLAYGWRLTGANVN